MTQISGERIWITGASSGIGRSMAILLAEQGNQVTVSARSMPALEQLASQYNNITALACDVSQASNIAVMGEQLSAINPYLDRIIINAGTCEYLDIASPDWAMMQRVMAVNYFGSIHSIAAALPLLQARPGGGGHVIGVVSMAAFVPFPRAEAYGASKAALQYFLDSLRIDLAPQGIDVTVVNPGFVKTPLTDKNDFEMPFIVALDKAAECIVKAIARRPRQYDFPGRLKWLLKTLGFFPSVWHRIIAPTSRG